MPVAEEPSGRQTQALFNELARVAGRPWVMLSAGATRDAFQRVLRYAYAAGASGYLAGRAIWWDAFAAFPDMESMRARLRTEALAYMATINALTDEQAEPWHEHPRFGSAGPGLTGAGEAFRARYTGFEGRQ